MAKRRVVDLSIEERSVVYQRMKYGSIHKYYDDENYLCFDDSELANWKPRKRGRKPIMEE